MTTTSPTRGHDNCDESSHHGGQHFVEEHGATRVGKHRNNERREPAEEESLVPFGQRDHGKCRRLKALLRQQSGLTA